MADGDQQDKPISLFYSYSHDDEDLRKRLETHLAAFRRSGLIADWHDRNIDVGEDWAKAIDRNLESADIILLLVSASFIASDYCWGVELNKALERHDRGEAKVIPVIMRHCRWGTTPFAKLQAAPTNAKPVTSWPDQDEALDDVAGKIERVVKELRSKGDTAAAVPASRTATISAETAGKAAQQARAAFSGTASVVSRKIADFAVFGDAPWCPELVALPAGEFMMGSPADEADRFDWEGPRHRVTIGYRLALGRYPVTVGEYRGFVETTNRRPEGGMYVWTGSEWKQDKSKDWRNPLGWTAPRHLVPRFAVEVNRSRP